MLSTLWEREAENEAESLIKRLKVSSLPVCPFTIANGFSRLGDIAALQHLRSAAKWLNSMQMIGRPNSVH